MTSTTALVAGTLQHLGSALAGERGPRGARSLLRSLLLVAVVGLLMAGAGCKTAAPKINVRPVGGLVIECTPDTAQVFVDDRYQGTVKALRGRPLSLLVGARRIELRHDGFFSAFHDVKIVRGVRQKLSVVLQREPF